MFTYKYRLQNQIKFKKNTYVDGVMLNKHISTCLVTVIELPKPVSLTKYFDKKPSQ